MVVLLGLVVSMSVGWTKYPWLLSYFAPSENGALVCGGVNVCSMVFKGRGVDDSGEKGGKVVWLPHLQ